MGESSAAEVRSQDHRRSVLTVITCSLLHLVAVKSIACCIPFVTPFGEADFETILNRNHVALAWLQVIPVLFWIPITRATWTATSWFAQSPNRAAAGMSWLLRVVAVLNLIAFVSVFIERVLEPNVRTTLLGTFRSFSYSIFWMSCLVFLFGFFRHHRLRKYVVASGSLIIYYFVATLVIEPKLASFFGSLSGPYSLNLFLLINILLSTALSGVFALSLVFLGYKSTQLVGKSL